MNTTDPSFQEGQMVGRKHKKQEEVGETLSTSDSKAERKGKPELEHPGDVHPGLCPWSLKTFQCVSY